MFLNKVKCISISSQLIKAELWLKYQSNLTLHLNPKSSCMPTFSIHNWLAFCKDTNSTLLCWHLSEVGVRYRTETLGTRRISEDTSEQQNAFTNPGWTLVTFKIANLDDNVSLPGAAPVQLAVLLHHHNLPLLLHLVCVFLHMVEDAPVVLLGDADELVEDDMGKAGELVVEQNTALHHSRVLKQQHRGSMTVGRERHERDGWMEEGRSNQHYCSH